MIPPGLRHRDSANPDLRKGHSCCMERLRLGDHHVRHLHHLRLEELPSTGVACVLYGHHPISTSATRHRFDRQSDSAGMLATPFPTADIAPHSIVTVLLECQKEAQKGGQEVRQKANQETDDQKENLSGLDDAIPAETYHQRACHTRNATALSTRSPGGGFEIWRVDTAG